MRPEYRKNLDDAPRPVAAMAKAWNDGDTIPPHLHKRGQLIHASTGIMRIETQAAAWIVSPALALWMPPRHPHSMVMRGRLDMRTVYIDAAICAALPDQPTLIEIEPLLHELILAALEEPLAYDEAGRGGLIAQLILTELRRMKDRRMAVPMPRDPRALRVARSLLENLDDDQNLDAWAEVSGASRRTLARLFRTETGFSFSEWRARLRAIDGLARLATGASVSSVAASVGYASPSAFSAMVRRNFGQAPRKLNRPASVPS
jgi:AraC-like DNA-binding protein